MTTISAKVILASRNMATGKVLTTMLLRYPRWIHAEARTHRKLRIHEEGGLPDYIATPSLMEDPALSRNASSSRAIPVEKLIADVISDPAVPLVWGRNQPGMQAGESHDAKVSHYGMSLTPESAWLHSMQQAIAMARAFAQAGYHKQIVNRLLEPFSHINVLVSATEWNNFFALRDHKDAEPHIQLLAKEMKRAMQESQIDDIAPGDWHLPFVGVTNLPDFTRTAEIMNGRLHVEVPWEIKASVARCARTSYRTHDGRTPSPDEDSVLYDRLVGSEPLHASPAEHVAQADFAHYTGGGASIYSAEELHANFEGFCQFRKMLPNEFMPG